jgi:two-component system, OmpR family, sensor histidine kinase BaeS
VVAIALAYPTMDDASRVPWTHRLGTRLAAAFTATALGAVAVVTAVTLLGGGTAVAGLTTERRAATTENVAAAVATAYERAAGWEGADLLPAHTLAAAAGAVLGVTVPALGELPVPPGLDETRRRMDRHAPLHDSEGHGHSTSQGPLPTSAPQGATSALGAAAPPPSTATTGTEPVEARLEAPVLVDDERIATVTLLFVERDLVDPTDDLGSLLTRNALIGAGAASALALLAAALVTPRLTRPLRRLVGAVEGIGRDRPPRAGPLPAAPGELGTLAVAIDRLAADLDRQEELRQGLVADVAHELRTPLTILLGEAEALKDGIVQPDHERLSSLHEEVQRLARLVEDVDTLAAAGAAGFGLRQELVDLAEVCGEAITGAEHQLADAEVRLHTDLGSALVHADRRRMEQVVRNLLSNAVKFSPPGSVVTVRVREEGGSGLLEICDDGPGIPPDELTHVFERFWRGPHADGVGGSGIGLSVVEEIVTAHGGEVRVENRAAGGLRVTVHLPMTQLPADRIPDR